MQFKVGIIIVTFNSQNDIARLLDSLLIQEYNDLVIYMVDNNSNDLTLSIVQEYKARLNICIIKTGMNNGYAKGNNIGINKAIYDKCEFVFILNPDMQLQKNCINSLVNRISSDNNIGVIGPIVLDGNAADNFIQSYGFNADFRTQKKNILFAGKSLTDEIPSEIYVNYVLGGAMMIRSSLLNITGLFEEMYFMYNDELDIAYRIKRAGFRTTCMRDAIVRHFHDFNKTNRKGNNLMYYYMMRNRYLYFKKYHLYFNLIFSLFKEIANIPFKIRWAIRRHGNINFLKFYYSGLVDGLLYKKGIANKLFD